MSDRLLNEAARMAMRYLNGIDDRKVAPDSAALEALATFDEPLPVEATDPHEVLRRLDEVGSPATVASAGRRFFGFVIGGSLPAALAAQWLAGAWDQNAAFHETSPVAATLERVAQGWLLDLLGLPAGTQVGFVTGGTMANFTALAAARHSAYRRVDWDVDNDGLAGAPPLTVVVGAEAHPTLHKALGLLGLGRRRVVTVPADDQGRMRVDAFPEISGPSIVCLQAGNVNSGAFDPLRPLIARAKDAGAWVHVDGAFGLWAAASPALVELMDGAEGADSWSTDGHKWLNVPYDSSLAFVRDADALRAAMSVQAGYLPDTGLSPADKTPELSRRARGVEVWAALRTLGRSGVADMIERTCTLARRFADGLSGAGHHVLNDVVLNQVLVSFGKPERTRRVIAEAQADGTCWFGGTVWRGQTAMRISVSSWATTEDDVDRCLDALVRIASKQPS